jgi:4-amino-4-deoxychorismate lyase
MPCPRPQLDYAQSSVPLVAVVLDSRCTPSSLLTATKTTDRAHYDAARKRAGVPPLGSAGPPRDVLLYNTEGQVTETSICNVAFFRSAQWLTPHISTGCLPGVMRRWLLEQDYISEDVHAILTAQNVIEDEVVLLFNGVQACQLGRIHMQLR